MFQKSLKISGQAVCSLKVKPHRVQHVQKNLSYWHLVKIKINLNKILVEKSSKIVKLFEPIFHTLYKLEPPSASFDPCTVGSRAIGMKTYRFLGMKTFFQDMCSRCWLILSRHLAWPYKLILRAYEPITPGFWLKMQFSCLFVTLFISHIHEHSQSPAL